MLTDMCACTPCSHAKRVLYAVQQVGSVLGAPGRSGIVGRCINDRGPAPAAHRRPPCRLARSTLHLRLLRCLLLLLLLLAVNCLRLLGFRLLVLPLLPLLQHLLSLERDRLPLTVVAAARVLCCCRRCC